MVQPRTVGSGQKGDSGSPVRRISCIERSTGPILLIDEELNKTRLSSSRVPRLGTGI